MGDLTVRIDLPAEVSVLPQSAVDHCASLMQRAATAPITTPTEMMLADDLAKEIRAAEKALDEARLGVRRKLMEPAERVQAAVAPLIDRLVEQRRALAQRIHIFEVAENQKREEELRRQREEALAQERAQHEAAMADAAPWEDPTDIPIARVDPSPVPPPVKSSAVRVVTRHRLVIEDRTLVPAYYVGIQLRELNERIVLDLLKRGASIPGVRAEAYEVTEHKA